MVAEVVLLSWFLAGAWLECSLSSQSNNSGRGGHTSSLVVTLPPKQGSAMPFFLTIRSFKMMRKDQSVGEEMGRRGKENQGRRKSFSSEQGRQLKASVPPFLSFITPTSLCTHLPPKPASFQINEVSRWIRQETTMGEASTSPQLPSWNTPNCLLGLLSWKGC